MRKEIFESEEEFEFLIRQFVPNKYLTDETIKEYVEHVNRHGLIKKSPLEEAKEGWMTKIYDQPYPGNREDLQDFAELIYHCADVLIKELEKENGRLKNANNKS